MYLYGRYVAGRYPYGTNIFWGIWVMRQARPFYPASTIPLVNMASRI